MTKEKIIKILKKDKSIYFIVLANIIPLLGVFFYAWDIFTILAFYWLETVTVGFWNIIKIFSAKINTGEKNIMGKKLAVVAFFCAHFGIFILIQFIIGGLIFEDFLDVNSTIMILGFFSFLISHGFSFVTNYIIKKEYDGADISHLLYVPYIRLVAMFIVVSMALIFIAFFSNIHLIILVVTVVLKTVTDIFTHILEHKKLSNYKYYVYIIQSQVSGGKYANLSRDVARSLKMHNEGEIEATIKHAPWKLIFKEYVGSKSQASQRVENIEKNNYSI